MASYSIIGASSSPLYTKKPNLIRSAILRATINDWPKTETIVDALVNGYNVNFKASYRYGENGYYRGLYQAANDSKLIDWDFIYQWLADRYNVSVNNLTILENELKDYASKEYRTYRVFDGRGYTVNPYTGYVSGIEGHPSNYVAEITSISSVEDTDPDDPDYFEIRYTAEYIAFDPSNRAATETEGAIKFSRNSYSQNSDLIKVKFTINSSVIMYLCYDPYNDEHFPALNESFLLSTKTKYFPIALLRLGAIGTPTEWIGEISSYSDEVNAEQYRQTKRLLKYWGVNIESIIDNLKENPDIDDVSRAFVTMAFSISDLKDIEEEGAQYLFRYLDFIIDKYDPPSKQEWLDDNYNVLFSKTKSLRFYEEVPSTLNTTLKWDYIDKENIPYNATKGGYSFGVDINYTENYDSSDFPGDTFSGEPSSIYIEFHDVKNLRGYRIRVGNLTSTLVNNYLEPDKTPLFTLRQAFPKSGEDTVTGILFPMHLDVLNSMSRSDGTSAAISSLTLVTQSFQQIKLKWYERDDFWNAIKIIIIAVSIVTMSPQLAAAAGEGITELAIYILESIVISEVVSAAIGLVLNLLADIIGLEGAAAIAAILAAASAVYGGSKAFNAGLPFADQVLTLSNMFMTSFQDLNNKRAKILENEIADFKEDYNEALDELKDIEDLLGEIGLNPFWLIQSGSSIVTGENATDFFTRNVNLNPNEACISSVTNYTENALRLPSVTDINSNFRG